MLILAPEGYFSRDYKTARKRFLAAANKVEAMLSRFPLDQNVEDDLFTDIAWIGPEKPKRALLVVSGIHGVEGFAGSAVQLGLLKHLPQLPDETALVLVHVLNPYGMQNLRRVNADNVDLNRNFIFNENGFAGASQEYRELDPLINPQKPPGFDLFSAKMLIKRLKHGEAYLTQAVAGGQHEYPRGLFYGGAQIEPEAAAYMEWLKASPLNAVEEIMILDLHTGLGAFGEQSLYMRSGQNDHEALSKRLRLRILADNKQGGGMVYDHEGGSSNLYEHLFPDSVRTCITVEYGTYGVTHILQALRSENQYHHYGAGQMDHWSKKNLKDAFCPHPDIWRKQVVTQGLDLTGRMLNNL